MRGKIASDSTLVAIDVGTTKICVLVARQTGPDTCDILGIGKSPSHGLARGVVVDIAPAVEAIKAAVKEAELMAGVTIESAAVGISGSHIQALTSHGMIPIKNGQIRPHDIAQVIATARSVPLPEGQQILHVLPQFFTIDGVHRVHDPNGMHGIRLEAQVHIITGGVSSVQNLVRCCEMAGVKVRDIVLEPLASADAVLSSDEKELGVAMLDIGGGTADFAIYHNGSIRHTRIFPIAGNLFTSDVALCLRTTVRCAERIKKEYGCAYRALVSRDEALEIEVVHGDEMQHVMRSELAEILASRAEELLLMVRDEMIRYQLHALSPAGIVLTGGGAMLAGMKELAQETLGLPARVGRPRGSTQFKSLLDHPMYATGYGLLMHELANQRNATLQHISGPMLNRVLDRMKSWVMDFF